MEDAEKRSAVKLCAQKAKIVFKMESKEPEEGQ
jgi:hypothetical protein